MTNIITVFFELLRISMWTLLRDFVFLQGFLRETRPKDRIHNISGTTGSQDASLVFAQEHGSNSAACARPTV